MKQILVTGDRPEISKVFELLMWQPDLKFINVKKLSNCLDHSLQTSPSLIIIEGNGENIKEVHEVIVSLKGSSKTAKTPVILTVHESMTSEVREELKTLIDDVISEPFSPKEVKKITGKYL